MSDQGKAPASLLGNGYNPYLSACPSRPLVDLLAAKWTILLVGLLSDGPRRFNEIALHIEGITPKALTNSLRALERNGLVLRTVYPVIPPRVEYELTELGQTFRRPVEFLLGWTEANIEECRAAQEKYDTRAAESA